jgi:hypothetical protein
VLKVVANLIGSMQIQTVAMGNEIFTTMNNAIVLKEDLGRRPL